MLVLCINDNWVLFDHNNCETPLFMQQYEVVDYYDLPANHSQFGIPLMAGRYYKLGGLNPNRGFHASHFAILPETSADEMKEEQREDIINIEPPIL